jgi:hypothetical protein
MHTLRLTAVAMTALLVSACSTSGGSSAGDADGGVPGDARGSTKGSRDGGSKDAGTKADVGHAHDSGPSSCAPIITPPAWKSPYAGWQRGVPSDAAFFPIAVWLQIPQHATELAGLGINIYLGNNANTDALAPSDLATLKTLGMYAIIGQDSVGLESIDDPTVVAWWMSPDEPDNAQPDDGGYGPPVTPSALVSAYDAYKAKDSSRPIFVGLGQGVAYDAWEGRGSNAPPESGYVAASDIIAFDIYPYNNCGGDTNEMATCGQFWLNAFGVDRLHMWSTRNQAVWTDFETTVISAGTTTGPTPVETASEVWLALIHEADGVIYFIDSWNPSFREDAIFENPAMVTAVTALNKQIQSLAPELNSASIPDVVTATSADSSVPVDVMIKQNGSSLYVFAAASRTGTTTATFAIEGMTGNATATVVGESRSVPVSRGTFSDAFAVNSVHIYEVDLSTVTCP